MTAVELNIGWVGGSCSDASSCSNIAFTGTPRCEATGFPNGFCTQSCTQSASTFVCPDATPLGGTERFTVTRCISANGNPTCVTECDFALSPSGCRPGYACVTRQRYMQSTRTFKVCLPEPSQRWPGETAPANDIGLACGAAATCGHNVCLPTMGGLCSKSMCDVSGCPQGSACFGVGNGQTTCLPSCTQSSQCRQAEGYSCNTQYGVCLRSANIMWNAAVGTGDCTTAWGNNGSGLHRCDTVKDDYVVVRKSARNLALCRNGSLVQNYRIGLGLVPTGDKEQDGDLKTPEGTFFLGLEHQPAGYSRLMVLSYPDEQDAMRAQTAGLITSTQKNAIDSAQQGCQLPPQTTALGSWVSLHGGGSTTDWTLGSVALENADIEAVWNALSVRDSIVVLP